MNQTKMIPVAGKPQPKSRLSMAKKGMLSDPLRFLFYGDSGIGKSSLAAAAPNPIFFDVEDGSGRLDIVRYSFRDGPGGHIPLSYAEVLAGIQDLAFNDSEYQTLVIDTADRLEALIHAFLVERESGRVSAFNKSGKKFDTLESMGYGRGYIIAVDEWRHLCRDLDELRMKRGMNVIIISHAQIRTFKNPVAEDFDRWQLRINEKAGGFLKEWADVVGFCTFEEGADRPIDGGDNARMKGFSTGRRLIKLERTAAFDAKSRIPLPPEVELSADNPWAPLGAAVEAGRNMPEDKLRELIVAECNRIGDAALTAKVKEACKSAKDTATLARYWQELKRRGEKVEPQEEASHE